jgi:hypothetical protein
MDVVTETSVVIRLSVDEARDLANACALFSNDTLETLSEAIADVIDTD